MKRPSLGTVFGAGALVIALGSTGVAADAASLITGKQIKNNSVTGKDIKNGSLTKADLARGTLPAAINGAAGRDGAAVVARVRSTGPVTTSDMATVPLSGGAFTQGPNEAILPMTVTVTINPPTCPSGTTVFNSGRLDLLIDGKLIRTVYPDTVTSTTGSEVVDGYNSTGSAVTHLVTATFHAASCYNSSTSVISPAATTLPSVQLDVARAS